MFSKIWIILKWELLLRRKKGPELPWQEFSNLIWNEMVSKWGSGLRRGAAAQEEKKGWGFSGREPSCQRRGHGLDPWVRRVPHAPGQLSPRATATWACVLEPRSHRCWAHGLQRLKPKHPRACALQQEKPPPWEALAQQLESGPVTSTQRKACAAKKTQHSQVSE